MILDKFDFESLNDYFEELVKYVWDKNTPNSEIIILLKCSVTDDVNVVSSLPAVSRARVFNGLFMHHLQHTDPDLHEALEAVYKDFNQKRRV